MRKLAAISFGCLALTVASDALAETQSASYKTVNDLVRDCDDNSEVVLACEFYLMGAIDALEGARFAGVTRSIVCVPVGATGSQLRAVVMRFWRENPERWHFRAGTSVILAFAKAFPCAPAAPG